ncbi:MAG: pyruvate kinase [Culicoidibacterales bacterium]
MLHKVLKKRTKIVTTIGPASGSVEMIKQLLESGANVTRVNFSHGEQSIHLETIKNIRTAAQKIGKTVGILADIKGPKIRAGEFNEDTPLKAGDSIRIQKETIVGTKEAFSTSYPGLVDDASIGDRVILDDGNIIMTVIDKDAEALTCRIENDSVIKSRKGVGLPGRVVNIPFMSDKDRSDIAFAATNGADFIAASFVRNKEDIAQIREVLATVGKESMPIISKIETKMAVDNLDEIIEHSDGIMVARGDLGIDLEFHQVPLVQKKIIRACNRAGKPVITATQMLESMIHNPRPTRAEASDVANAILDGTDAIMLSGESAVGDYPVEAVKTMYDIANFTEASIDYHHEMAERMEEQRHTGKQQAFAFGATQIALDIEAKAIVIGTKSGRSARIISNFRPNTYVIAVCDSDEVARSLTLYSGITAVHGVFTDDLDQIVKLSVEKVKERFELEREDQILIVGGVPAASGNTNFIKTVQMSEVE